MTIDSNCLFCKIALKQIPAKIVHEDDLTLAFADIHPQAPTHVLIIPRIHVASVQEMGAEHDEYLLAMFAAARTIARESGLADDGYRLVLNCRERAGQSVFHVHMHLLGGRAMHWPPG
jgi:histidine triad (HIT) family protein